MQLPVCGVRRDVHLKHSVYAHILGRRIHDGDGQMSLVLRRMTDVVTKPTHIGLVDRGGPGRFALYGRNFGDADPAGLCVCIKCLDGETWVSTAFPVGVRRLAQYLSRGALLLIP